MLNGCVSCNVCVFCEQAKEDDTSELDNADSDYDEDTRQSVREAKSAGSTSASPASTTSAAIKVHPAGYNKARRTKNKNERRKRARQLRHAHLPATEPDYFERQKGNMCMKHAVNNCFGAELLTEDDLELAVKRMCDNFALMDIIGKTRDPGVSV